VVDHPEVVGMRCSTETRTRLETIGKGKPGPTARKLVEDMLQLLALDCSHRKPKVRGRCTECGQQVA
jgi:hypothetical protein